CFSYCFGLSIMYFSFFSSRRRHTRSKRDWSSDVCSSDLKFARCLQRRFGIIPHVTDKNYITNSYHVHVTEPIDAFSKLGFEAEFQALSPGGAISYVEDPNLQHNNTAVLAVMKFI